VRAGGLGQGTGSTPWFASHR